MRIVFFGTPEFALRSLEALMRSRHEVVSAVCQPDRPLGRGLRTHKPPVGCMCETVSIPVCQPDSLKSAGIEALFRETGAEIGVVVAYGKLISRRLLAVPRFGFVNVHASLLPRYRGASPVARALIGGDAVTGVSIMKLDEGMDTGPIYASASTHVDPCETAAELGERLAIMGAEMLVETLDALEAGTARAAPQCGEHSIAPLLVKADGKMDWTRSAVSIHNLVRGVNPWPGAFCSFRGSTLNVWRTAPAEGSGEPGTVLAARGKLLRVAAGEGAIDLLEVQLPGRKRLGPADFINGARLAAGDRFGNAPEQER